MYLLKPCAYKLVMGKFINFIKIKVESGTHAKITERMLKSQMIRILIIKKQNEIYT